MRIQICKWIQYRFYVNLSASLPLTLVKSQLIGLVSGAKCEQNKSAGLPRISDSDRYSHGWLEKMSVRPSLRTSSLQCRLASRPDLHTNNFNSKGKDIRACSHWDSRLFFSYGGIRFHSSLIISRIIVMIHKYVPFRCLHITYNNFWLVLIIIKSRELCSLSMLIS